MKKKPFDQNNKLQELHYQPHKEKDEALGNLLKSAFTEEEKKLHLTKEFKSTLADQMKAAAAEDRMSDKRASSGVIPSIRRFLNLEIEIPLVPVLAASVLLVAINVMPLNYEPRPEGRLIEVGGAQLWIPSNGEGEDYGYEN
jgi:hypothetical protein